jgi:hypothetical protein
LASFFVVVGLENVMAESGEESSQCKTKKSVTERHDGNAPQRSVGRVRVYDVTEDEVIQRIAAVGKMLALLRIV